MGRRESWRTCWWKQDLRVRPQWALWGHCTGSSTSRRGGYRRFKGRTDPVLTLLLIVWEDTGLVEVGVASQPHNIDKRICWAPFVCGLWTGVETGSWWWWWGRFQSAWWSPRGYLLKGVQGSLCTAGVIQQCLCPVWCLALSRHSACWMNKCYICVCHVLQIYGREEVEVTCLLEEGEPTPCTGDWGLPGKPGVRGWSLGGGRAFQVEEGMLKNSF